MNLPKKVVLWEYFPFVCLVVAMLLFHFTISLGFGDDAVMGQIVAGRPLPEYLADMYGTWSSRMVAHFFMVVFCVYLPGAAFRIVNTLVVFIVALCIAKLLPRQTEVNARRRVNWVVCALVLVYPMFHMATAGWIATSVNYMWVLAFVLLALLPIKKILSGLPLKWYEYILCAAALLLGANAEQGLVVLLAVYATVFVYCLAKRRKVHWFLWLQLGLLVFSIAVFALSPGNGARLEVETAQYFPEFGALSIADKAGMGLARTLDHFLLTPNAMMLATSVLLGVAVFSMQKSPLKRAVSLTPLFSVSVFALLLPITGNLFPGLVKMVEGYHALNTYEKDMMGLTEGTAGNNYLQYSNYIATAILLITLVCLFVSVWLAFGKNKKSLFLTVFVLGCLGATCAMGFSPTIYASAERTFLFMYAALIVLGAALYTKLEERKSRYVHAVLFFIVGLGVLAFISGR